MNYFFFVAEEVRQIMAQLGIRQFDDLIGRADLLDTRKGVEHWKAQGLDFSRLFAQPVVPADVARCHVDVQDHGLDKALDVQADRALPALPSNTARRCASWKWPRNVNRSVGAMLSGAVDPGAPEGLPDDTIRIQLRRHGRPVVRRLPGKRHHAEPDRRGQRLHRQGPVGWPRGGASHAMTSRATRTATSSWATP